MSGILRIAEIAQAVAQSHGCTVAELRSRTLSRMLIEARQEAYARCYALQSHRQGPYSLPRIGRFFGRGHTTVLHAVRVHAARIAEQHERGHAEDCGR